MQLILSLNMNHPLCVYEKLKIQVLSVKTQLYYLTNQLRVSSTVSSHHQADPKDIKRKKYIGRANLKENSFLKNLFATKWKRFTHYFSMQSLLTAIHLCLRSGSFLIPVWKKVFICSCIQLCTAAMTSSLFRNLLPLKNSFFGPNEW
jgi:hypothetical protein